jgi:putative transposase
VGVVGWDDDTRAYPLCRLSVPAEIMSHAVWLYFRFPLGLRMVEELVSARGILVSHETVWQRAFKFGQRSSPIGSGAGSRRLGW